MANQVGKSKYRLKVTAGPDYDPSTHKPVEVNGKTLKFESPRAQAELNVRIQDYGRYPDSSPFTSPYFRHPLPETDQYSISSSIVFKEDINGNDVVFGNDFDYPIRDILPWGFMRRSKP
ncbi:hypothetical protein N7478_007387 [Penicillium angulare]|uniref:uncharacterized protein n=1 Tax=Penicillium angulare TaxID=116970 RepID=UPI00253FAB25|nr:uncharacterized protein N7478_007387 [Penicillium angulare]KAJ5282015.1 hypothetical protein N7478_007387 [Penicillium angulare]